MQDVQHRILTSVLGLLALAGLPTQPSRAQEGGLDQEEFSECNRPNDVKRVKVIQNLINQAVDGRSPGLLSIDGFIAALPAELRRAFITMSRSRSLQKSDRTHPRVILHDGGFFGELSTALSFGTHPQLPGYDRIEMMLWNTQRQRFDFLELEFRRPPLPPKLTKDPPSCILCHRDPGRPNWESPRVWAGMTPATDVVAMASDAAQTSWYAEYLKKIERKEDRFRSLLPQMTSESLLKSIGAGTPIDLPDQGPAFDLFRGLNEKNACRVMATDGKKPAFKRARYALRAIFMTCKVATDFAPEWYRLKARDHFAAIGVVGPGADPSSVVDALIADTRKRQRDYDTDKLDHVGEELREHIAKERTASELVAMAAHDGTKDPEVREIAMMRYYLEPLGIPVERWSMAMDPTSYTFGDDADRRAFTRALANHHDWKAIDRELERYRELDSFPEIDQYSDCPLLKRLSLESFDQSKPQRTDSEKAPRSASCVPKPASAALPSKQASELSNVRRAVLKNEAARILRENQCVNCHTSGIVGAPKVPFNNLDSLEKLVQDTRDLPAGGWAERVISRIDRDSHSPGRMPLIGTAMNPTDRDLLIQYLRSIVTKE